MTKHSQINRPTQSTSTIDQQGNLSMSAKEWHADINITESIAKSCIEQQFEQLTPLQSITCIGEGWDNKVFLINETIIFRFPRRKVAIQLIETENILLKNLQSRFSLDIPNPIYIGKPGADYPYPFQGYPILRGSSGCQAKLTTNEHDASIKPLARFLKELHSITEHKALKMGAKPQMVRQTHARAMIKTLQARVDKINELNIVTIDHHTMQQEMKIAEDIILPDEKKVLVHGDLYCRHLLFDHGKLTAIIDWGDVGISHRSMDLAVIFSFYPSHCHTLFFEIYGEVDPKMWQHARFIGLYSSLTVLLYAHDISDHLLVAQAKKSIQWINPDLCIL